MHRKPENQRQERLTILHRPQGNVIFRLTNGTFSLTQFASKYRQISGSDEPEPSWLEPQLELKYFQLGSARLVTILLQLGLIFFSSKIRKLPFFAAQRKKMELKKATYKKTFQYYEKRGLLTSKISIFRIHTIKTPLIFHQYVFFWVRENLIVNNIKKKSSSVSAPKLKCPSSAWLGSEPSQLGSARAGNFRLGLITKKCLFSTLKVS